MACNLGPSQTANSLDSITRKQVSYINEWHISSDKIDNATNHIINLYKKFNILKHWGTGERVVYHMTDILQNLSLEGYDVKDTIASLAPYITSHINRFGKYSIDKNIKIPELKFDIEI